MSGAPLLTSAGQAEPAPTASPTLACFLEAALDSEVFLTDLAGMVEGDPPPVVTWSSGPHLVFAFHNHSGLVWATEFGPDDPRVFGGFDDDPDPLPEEGRARRAF